MPNIRISPSGPELVYPTADSGKVLTVGAGGNVTPQAPSASAIPVPVTSHIVFVSQLFGNDTGDGSMSRPYATIGHAYSTITTATLAAPWQIVLFAGIYAENIALKPFILIEGWEKTRSTNQPYPATINGNVTLDASFSAADAYACLTALDVLGTTTLNFAGSANGSVYFTGVQLNDITVSGVLLNIWELHECMILGNVTQTGGRGNWFNTKHDAPLLHVRAATGTAARLDLNDSVCIGDLTADQNGATAGGELCTVNLFNSQAREGLLTISASGSNCPTVNGAYGSTPENPGLTGSAAAKLSNQMRVSLDLTVPTSTVIPNGEVTDIVIPLAGSVLGATSIEELDWMACPIGTAWATQLLSTGNCLWSFHVVQNGAAAEFHVVIGNIGTTPVTTAADLHLLFAAYVPSA